VSPAKSLEFGEQRQAGYDLALATTDLAASPAQVFERYANRWSRL